MNNWVHKMEFSGINLLSLIFCARLPELISMVVRSRASNYLTSHRKRQGIMEFTPTTSFLCHSQTSFVFSLPRIGGHASCEHHRIQHISLLAYRMGSSEEKGRGCLWDSKALQPSCPESKSPPYRGYQGTLSCHRPQGLRLLLSPS